MSHRAKGIFLASLALGWILLLACPAPATTLWMEGQVTQGAWMERYRHIEVDGVKFTLMPRARIHRLYQTRAGMFQYRRMPLNRIHVGQNVRIRIQGHRIYEIIVR